MKTETIAIKSPQVFIEVRNTKSSERLDVLAATEGEMVRVEYTEGKHEESGQCYVEVKKVHSITTMIFLGQYQQEQRQFVKLYIPMDMDITEMFTRDQLQALADDVLKATEGVEA